MIESKKTKQQLDADKVRSFIAIETNQKVKKTSDELIEKLKRMGFRASWTKTSNTHLTLFFLGDQNITKLAQLAYKIGDRLAGFPTFHFYVEKLGFFERNSIPRVLWLGIREDTTLNGLYEEIKKVLKMCEFEVKEKVFTPHITIGRVKNYPKHWKELLSSTSFEEIKVFVNSIEIYSSELTKNGPMYNKLYTIDFEGGVIINGQR